MQRMVLEGKVMIGPPAICKDPWYSTLVPELAYLLA